MRTEAMVILRKFRGAAMLTAGLLAALLASSGVYAAKLPGYGELSGTVRGTRGDALAVVHAVNLVNRTAYTVFVVDGRFRATTMLPGRYRVTV